MSDLLVVLNPRNIPECMKALDELPIDKLYLRGWTERAIADGAWKLVMDRKVDWLWVTSDDVIIRPPALKAVRTLSKQHPVVTGYAQRSHTEWIVNLTDAPLSQSFPDPTSYSFRSFAEVVSYPDPVVPTWFTGMSLTGMSLEMWKQFPFDCYENPGYASDFHLSWRLQKAAIPIVAAREGFCYHWRHDWVNTNDPRDETPQVGRQELVLG